MGYYSDVALVLSEKAAQALRKRIEEAKEDATFQVDFADKYLKVDGAELYYWEKITWYTAYPEVQWMKNFIDSLDKEGFLFIRIGENYGDMEYDGEFLDNPFFVTVSRKITFNG